MPIAFSPVVVSSGEDIEHAIAQINDADLRSEDTIAVRLGYTLWRNLIAENRPVLNLILEQISLIRRRAPNFDILVFPDGHDAIAKGEEGSMGDLRPRVLINAREPTIFFMPVEPHILAELRSEDMSRIIGGSLSRCVIRSSSNHHFSLPSGAHSSQFVRLAEAFTNITVVDSIAYWAALHILQSNNFILDNQPTCIVVDNPSMLVLSSRMQKLLSGTVELHALESYPSCVETNRSVIELFDMLTERTTNIYLVIGISSIGGLFKFINNRTSCIKEALVLFALSPTEDITSLCTPQIDGYEIYKSEEACSLCKSGSTPVKIHGSTYLAGHSPATPVPLKRELFTSQKDFFQKYGKHPGVLRVHYNDPNESTPRHHAFYIDVSSLFVLEEFRKHIKKTIQLIIPKPDLVVSPKHDTAVKIGRLAAEALGCHFFAVETPLQENGNEFTDYLVRSKNILVIDDVLISGSRFDNFNRAFRETAHLTCEIDSICYFAALATPPSENAFAQRVKGLTTNHDWKSQVLYLYKIILPDWHTTRECPWCAEHEILVKLMELDNLLDAPLDGRIAELSEKKLGIQENCFSFHPENIEAPLLGSKSVILPEGSTSTQVLFSCASALQQARTNGNHPLEPNAFPTPRYIAKRVFSDHYTERLIWLALLRTVKASELEPALKLYFLEVVESLEKEPEYIKREIALAWLSGKLGSIGNSRAMQNLFLESGFDWDAIVASGYTQVEVPEVDEHASASNYKPQSGYYQLSSLYRVIKKLFCRFISK
ncbi:MAG: phosphoribosyltransferase [Pseudoalteromonas distincta]